MNVLFHLLILFIYVYALLMLNIPQIEHDDYIKQKLYIFLAIFLVEFLIDLFNAIYNRCIINLGRIAKDSLVSALFATVGYAIYNDLIWMSNPWVAGQDTPKLQNLAITIIIVAFITIGYFIEVLFTGFVPGMNDCLNTIYPAPTQKEHRSNK